MVIDPEIDLIYVPKSICLISRLPVFDLQRQFLIHLYKSFIISKRDQKEKIINLSMSTKQANRLSLYSSESGEKRGRFSYNPDSPGTRSGQYVKEQNLLEFYISMLFSLMPLEEEAKEKAFLKLESKDEEFLRFRLNNSIGLNLMNFSFKSLFKRLSLDNILKIIKFILLERQLIFFSSEPGEIANITESLLYLIAPL
jgi:hypothetical protein